MRRTILALTVIALVAAMAGIAALSVTAQEDSEGEPTDPYPWEDTTSDPSEDEGTDPEATPEREARTICAPEWLIEWEPWYSAEGAWWVGWWYQWCHTNRYGWWRSYDSWFWGPPV